MSCILSTSRTDEQTVRFAGGAKIQKQQTQNPEHLTPGSQYPGANSDIAMIARAYSVLVGLALASSASTSDESSVYVIYREDSSPAGSGCSSPGNFVDPIVGLRGFVLDEDYALLGGRSDEDTGTCVEEMACFVSPQSEACLSLGRTFEAYGEIIAQDVPDSSASLALPKEDGEPTSYYNCVRKTPSFSSCYRIGCGSSSLYPHCSFDIISPSDLASNLDTLLLPDSNGNNDIVYTAHYSDAACSTESFVGVRGFLADGSTGTQLPLLSGDVDCAQSMACLLQPDSFACGVLSPLDVAEVTVGALGYATPDDAIYQVCLAGDNGGSEKCQGISSGSCVQSPVYPSCYIRLL